MSDKIRQAAVECAEYIESLRPIEPTADIIERAMRKLLPSEPNPYAIAMEKHLCERDIADWLACAGHGDNFCTACNSEKEHSHNSHPEASASVRLDGETHCASESPTPASEDELGEKIVGTLQDYGFLCRRLAEHCSENLLPIIRAHVAERVKEAVETEREAICMGLDVRKKYWQEESSAHYELIALEKWIRARGVEAKR